MSIDLRLLAPWIGEKLLILSTFKLGSFAIATRVLLVTHSEL